MNLHIKEFTIHRVDHQLGFVIEGCPAGQGRLDVPWLLQELHASGRTCQRHPGTVACTGIDVGGDDRERGTMGSGECRVSAYTDRRLKPDIRKEDGTMTKIALLGRRERWAPGSAGRWPASLSMKCCAWKATRRANRNCSPR